MAVTWNPSDKGAGVDLSNGNLTAEANATGTDSVRATDSKSSGKWYWEILIDVNTADGNFVGIGTSGASITEAPGYDAYGYGYEAMFGNKGHSNSWTGYGNSFTTNDIIGVALDLDNGKIWFAKNNVWQASGNPAAGTNAAYTGLSGTFFPMHSPKDFPDPDPADKATARFDAGDQSYSPPSGFSSIGETEIFGEISDEVGVQDAFVLELPFWKDIADEVGSQDAFSVETTYNLTLADDTGLGDTLGCEIYITMLTPYDAYHLQTADTPSIEYIITSPLGEVDLELPFLEAIIYSGATADIELPKFEVEAVGTIGSVYKGDIALPSFSIESKTGSQVDIELSALNVDAEALTGVTASADLELQPVKLDASALLDILANLDTSLPKLLATSKGICGVNISGDVKLYPLKLLAEGYAGKRGIVDVSLPSFVVEGELAHVPIGEGSMEFPSFDVDAEMTLLRDPCLGPNILKHNRWS